MVKRRDLKKDINYMVKEVINECHLHLYYAQEIDQENVIDIINEAKKLRQDLIKKVNNHNISNGTLPKEYYQGIVDELYSKCMIYIDRLNSLSIL